EKFFPVDATYHLSNSVLKRRNGENVEIVDLNPTVGSIADKGENFFLASKLGGLEEIAEDYAQNKDILGYTVYSRVVKDSGFIAIQYWFFYAYNDASLNEHEGDWEMIQILLNETETPVSAAYSQHLKGQAASWADVEKTDSTHPKVYVARGSHANYFRSYQGRLGMESDEVGADGVLLHPSDLTLVLLGELEPGEHPPAQAWLRFGGRWGNWGKLADAAVGFAGPYGPAQGDNSFKWLFPVSWAHQCSTVDGTWFMASWFAANFLLIFIVVTVVLSLWKVWRIIKIKKKTGFQLPKVLRSKAALGIILGALGIILTVGGMLLPWYTIRADIQSEYVSTHGEADLLIMDGPRGLQVNLLAEDRPLSPVFALQIPIGLLLLVGIVFGILDIIGIETTNKLGNKYLRGGIAFIIIFILIVIFIVQLIYMLPPLASSFGITLPPEAAEMAQTVAQQPLQGTQTKDIGGFGSVYLSWGLGIGAYMLLAAAVTKLVGGVILKTQKIPPKPEKEQPLPPPP
ncbi:MAG: hypothetical protein ACLFU9_05280, partial [Candidatus Bathyarchaeia archaeon]